MTIRARYTGGYDERRDEGGELLERSPRGHLEGIPARSLDDEEWDALDKEQRAAVRASGLYDVKTEAEARPKHERAAESESAEGTVRDGG